MIHDCVRYKFTSSSSIIYSHLFTITAANTNKQTKYVKRHIYMKASVDAKCRMLWQDIGLVYSGRGENCRLILA